jgi:DNA-binding NtrC family response regulator
MTPLASTVLIVDDLEEARWPLRELVKTEGLIPIEAASSEEALRWIHREAPDLVLLDVCLPSEMDGFAVLDQIKRLHPTVPVIMVTGNGRTEDAVRAMKAGTYDYLTKPFRNHDVALTIRRALENRRSKQQVCCVPDFSGEERRLTETMGSSAAVERLMADVDRVAATAFAVLVTGETGTGKELVARAIHANSGRAGKPFVAVDCGAIPESLIERELFGHEKGAFTGAHQAVPGAFELAHQGTLFLDEIGNLPLAVQATLLRVLEERRIRRIGSTKISEADCRVIAATNQDIRAKADHQAFRLDLYHRLAEFTILVPPLRERKDDIPFLIKRFLDLTNRELGRAVRGVAAPALQMMMAYNWPGNVRELRNQLRRAMLYVSDQNSVITPECLEMLDRRGCGAASAAACKVVQSEHLDWLGPGDFSCRDCPFRSSAEAGSLKESVSRVVARVERTLVIQALRQSRGNKAEAARRLQIDYKTIQTKLKQHGILADEFRAVARRERVDMRP